MEASKEIVLHYCERCKNNTRHGTLYNRSVQNPPRGSNPKSTESYQTVECLGCKSVSFRIVFTDEDMNRFNLRTGYFKPYSTYSRYPKVIKNYTGIDSAYLSLIPDDVLSIYKESLSSFANKLYLLTAAGFRTTIEAVCKEKNVKGESLHDKIDNLYESSYLQKQEVDELHGVKFLGNDSVHRMLKPTPNQLLTALKLIDNLLTKVYHLEAGTSNILDTRLTNYSAFDKKVKDGLKKFAINDEKSLEVLLGDQYRRFDSNDLKKFETMLISKIVSEEYTYLKLGKIKTVKTGEIQYYIISVDPALLIEQLPL